MFGADSPGIKQDAKWLEEQTAPSKGIPLILWKSNVTKKLFKLIPEERSPLREARK